MAEKKWKVTRYIGCYHKQRNNWIFGFLQFFFFDGLLGHCYHWNIHQILGVFVFLRKVIWIFMMKNIAVFVVYGVWISVCFGINFILCSIGRLECGRGAVFWWLNLFAYRFLYSWAVVTLSINWHSDVHQCRWGFILWSFPLILWSSFIFQNKQICSVHIRTNNARASTFRWTKINLWQ